MTDFKSDQEFADYIEKMPPEQLVDISLHLDSDKYPERHLLVHDLIGQRNLEHTVVYCAAEMNDSKGETIPKGMVISRRVYLTLAVICAIGIPLFLIRDILIIERFLSLLLNVGLYSLAYFGLRRRRAWVVTLVLFVANLNLLMLFIGFLSSQGFTVTELVINRIGGLLLATFWISQILIFSKQATREYFKETGTTLIGIE